MFKLKRIYEASEASDGYRVLVDRIWPRGVSKEKARIDLWMKEIAPSDALRKWFGHDPERWEEFQRRYREELQKANWTDKPTPAAREAARYFDAGLFGPR